MKRSARHRLLLASLAPLCLLLASCSSFGGSADKSLSLSSLEQQFKSALSADEKAHGQSSPQVADDLIKLGDLYRDEGKLGQSQSALKRAVDIRKSEGAVSVLALAKCLNSHGLTLVAQGDLTQAESVLQDAMSIREKNKGEPAVIAESQNSLGQLYYAGGVLPESKQWFEKSFATTKSAEGTDSTNFAEVQNNLAGIYFAEGKFEQSEQMFQSSLNIYEKALAPDRPEIANCKNNLAEVYRAEGKYSQAEPQYKDAIAIYQKIGNQQDTNLACCLNNLALLYQKQNMFDKSEPLYKQALSVEEAADSAGKRDLTNTLTNYAKLLHATNRESEAKTMDARVRTLVASQQ